MPDIDVVDSTWICARPSVVAAAVAEPANWRRWWPDLELVVDEWRGPKGVRWTVRSTRRGEAGSMEVWLEPAHDGVVAHYFLRLDLADGAAMSPRRKARATDSYRRQAKRAFWALGDQLDPGRIGRVEAAPGTQDRHDGRAPIGRSDTRTAR
ncbi:MAG: hypothetical protein JWO57_4435 [Pseudonocardiales bacterium]|nr:hypothetical protein [Pseudonocardiales bacterium]